jgi:hypothetical protein
MKTKWTITYRTRRFLGGFDGEFRYTDWTKGQTVLISTSARKPSPNQARKTVELCLHNRKADIEILNIIRSGE